MLTILEPHLAEVVVAEAAAVLYFTQPSSTKTVVQLTEGLGAEMLDAPSAVVYSDTHSIHSNSSIKVSTCQNSIKIGYNPSSSYNR